MLWIIVAALLALCALLAMMPIRLLIAYSMQSVSVKLKVGFITFPLIPAKAKKKRAKAKKPGEKKKPKDEKTSDKEDLSLTDYLNIAKKILDLLIKLRSKLVMRQFDFHLILAGNDPCDLAVLYGRAQAAFYTVWTQIENAFEIRKHNVGIDCDFAAEKTVLHGFVDISISFGRLLAVSVKYGLLILKEYFTINNNKKAVQ